MARPKEAVHIIKPLKGKVLDITLIQKHDFVKFRKNIASNYMLKPLMKGMGEAALEFRGQVQKNLTSMKAVLSGYLRNEFPIWMTRPDADTINIFCATDLYYALLVHEGWGIHAAAGKKGRKGGKGASEEGFAKAPPYIIAMQMALLKKRKGTGVKGKRPFFIKAFDEKKNTMIRLIRTGAIIGVERALNMAARKVTNLSGQKLTFSS